MNTSKVKLPKEDRDLWLKALRSEKYSQGEGQLKIDVGRVRYCCLGIFCEVKDLEYEGYQTVPVKAVKEPSKLPQALSGYWDDSVSDRLLNSKDIDRFPVHEKNFVTVLGVLNDVLNQNFLQIADYIEQTTVGI